MGYSPVFEWVCSQLEQRTGFARIEARGTVRLALKQAGLEPQSVTSSQMQVVIARLLPAALAARRVNDSAAVCDVLQRELRQAAESDAFTQPESAYDIFDRLGKPSGGDE